MRFENSIGSETTFYYEVGGKQENKLFVVRFSMGSVINNKDDFQIHSELKSYKTYKEMQDELDKLKQYCLQQGHKQVKATKRNVIT
jgi:hypothetical protein